MKRRLTAGAVATATGLAFLVGLPTSPAAAAPASEYTVVADDGVSAADAATGRAIMSATTHARNPFQTAIRWMERIVARGFAP